MDIRYKVWVNCIYHGNALGLCLSYANPQSRHLPRPKVWKCLQDTVKVQNTGDGEQRGGWESRRQMMF